MTWHAANVPPGEAFEESLVGLLGPGVVVSGRLCPLCGSAEHGRPWARHEGVEVHVSLSRAGAHLVIAVALTGPVGVDVESVAAVLGGWDASLVLAAGEAAESQLDRARVWARKEAVLKAYGVGLSRPMTDVCLGEFGGELHDLAAPEGYLAAVALLR